MNTQSRPKFVIVAAVDETETAEAVIKEAASLAAAKDADLHIVQAYQAYAPRGVYDDAEVAAIAEENQTERATRMQALVTLAQGGCDPNRIWGHLVRGEAVDAVLGVANNVVSDLIIVGTHDYRGLTRFLLGSVSESISRKAHCPVMLLRPVSYPASKVPTIEPPCSDCVRVRNETKNASAWCERHSQSHAQAILHYEYPSGYGAGAQLFRP